MDAQGDAERERAAAGAGAEACEGDERARHSLVRCASQSSLDESSQRRGADADAGAGAAHAAALLGALARLRRDELLCDVRLQAEGAAPLPAHRAVLAAGSPYFRAMFTQFDERTQPLVLIRGVEPAALAAVLDYVYEPASLRVSERNVQSVLAAASLLQVPGARAAACAFLAAALAPDNALGIRAFADLHACSELADAAARFVERRFVEVLDAEEFLALDADALGALLDSDRLAVPDEEVVLDAVLRWMRHDPEARRARLGALLEHVRLPLLPQDALVARAAAEPLASAELRVKDLVIEALSFHLLRRSGAGVGVAGGALFAVGGHDGPAVRRSVERFRPGEGWGAAPPMAHARRNAGVAAHHGRLYVVGGDDGAANLASVEVFDPAAEQWSLLGAAMQVPRSYAGVAVVERA